VTIVVNILTISSHLSHIPYTCDLYKAYIYAANTISKEESSIHQPITHTYYNTVIFMHID
jgi:hypothetical protein